MASLKPGRYRQATQKVQQNKCLRAARRQIVRYDRSAALEQRAQRVQSIRTRNQLLTVGTRTGTCESTELRCCSDVWRHLGR